MLKRFLGALLTGSMLFGTLYLLYLETATERFSTFPEFLWGVFGLILLVSLGFFGLFYGIKLMVEG